MEVKPANQEETKLKTNFYTYLTIIIVDILGFSFGLSASWSSPMLFKLESDDGGNPLGHPITTNEESWLASISSLGNLCSYLPFGFIASKLGRKPALLLAGVLMAGAFFIFAFTSTITWFYIARFILGAATGGLVSVSGIYKLELCHHTERTFLTSIGLSIVSFGVLLPYVIGPYVSFRIFNLFCGVFPVVFCAFFFFFAYETPPFLLSVNKKEEALTVLTKYRGESTDFIEKELSSIQQFLDEYGSTGTLIDLFRSRVLIKCLIISVLLLTASHFCGVIPILTFNQEIFEAAGTNIPSDISTIIVNGVQFLLSFLGPLILTRFRYRTLILSSCLGLAVALTSLGTYFYLKDNTDFNMSPISWIPIVAMLLAFSSFIYGLAIVPGIMMVEMFPTDTRSMAIMFTNMIGSVQTFLLNRYFLGVAEAIGIAACFWFFAGICVVAFAVFTVVIPETKGKTFQEVQSMLRAK